MQCFVKRLKVLAYRIFIKQFYDFFPRQLLLPFVFFYAKDDKSKLHIQFSKSLVKSRVYAKVV